ncbi:Vacuolar protein sorting-associated protein 54 [Ancistrocladus abbreviatus]
MDSLPSQSGRFNVDTTPTSTSSVSSTPNRENSLGRKHSSSLNKGIFEHNLSSILNNPHSSRSGDVSWVGWWSSSTSVILPEFSPINTTRPELETSRSDFQPYLSSISEQFHRFEDIRNHTNEEIVDFEKIGGQGEALVACLREIPALYFKEDFELEDGATFRAACPFSTVAENLVLQERLSQYLDVVEVHLVKEISLRSNSFFEAQRQLADMNVKVVEGCKRIRELKETIRLLNVDLVDSARQIQDLNGTRSNLLALQQKLRLILYVNQAVSTLKLLVTSADSAGALDVADDLQHLLDDSELTGLHCFRHLRDHVAASIDAINSILSAEFLHASLHDAGALDVLIVTRAKERASLPTIGRLDEVKLDEEEASNLRDRLVPHIVGLLRTAKLPSVLRMYRDTLTADMKTAIKTVVAELLPVLFVQPLESDFSPGERTGDADSGGPSLASRLKSLSSESFVQLLGAIFKIVLAHLVRAAEVKKSIEWIMSNLDGHYAAESVAAAIAHGAAVAETACDNTDAHVSSLLHSTKKHGIRVPSLQGKGNEVVSPSNMSRNFRADVLRENTEAVFAACDTAHARCAKLLGVRASLHPRLRLQEFLSIYNITQEFITATEKIGGRLGYETRGTLQSQAKAFIDFQHESRMAKIRAALDQETWVEVDVPDEFQAIVISILGSDPLSTEIFDDVKAGIASGYSDVVTSDSSHVADTGEGNAQQHMEHNALNNISAENDIKVKLPPSDEANEKNKSETVTSVPHGNNNNIKDRVKSTSNAISLKGVSYHMVNCGLILLKMLSEYIDMNNNLPAFSSEIVHRVVEVLKFFNMRTCQLVLGAGAMQVSGLKSITSKHLALASQVISFSYAIIPDIKQVLFLKVPEARKSLLLLEINRIAQDYKVHRDEIHTKLVQIMRERLLVHLRGLPQIVEGWNRPEDNDQQPSQFARSLTKEVGYLQRVLSRTLHEGDVQAIFRQVVIIFHTQISEAFSRLEVSTPQAKNRLYRDVQHILGCIQSLPSDISTKSDVPNWGQLDEFFAQHFSGEAGQ